MDLDLTGKVALVTGASKGIGLSIAQALAAEGATVIGAARTASAELTAVAAEVITADLTRAEEPARVVRTAIERHGELDILVNNVGGGDAGDLRMGCLDYDDVAWQRTFDLNFFATVRTCRAALASVVQTAGVVVNISSIGARMPHTAPTPYTASKASLNAFTKSLAEEYGALGVRVLTVTPGPTRTPLWTDPGGFGAALAEAQGITHEEFMAGLATASGIRSGRLVEPEHVASLVAYLCSPLAISLTGQEYLVDGGVIKTT